MHEELKEERPFGPHEIPRFMEMTNGAHKLIDRRYIKAAYLGTGTARALV
jgi:hypothetical protein